MVDPLYTRLEATARRLIAKYGKPAAVVRRTTSGPPHAPVVTETAHACTVADIGYSLTNRDATLIQTGDKVGIMSTDLAIVPALPDKLRIDGQDYAFVEVQPLNPGGLTLLWEYVARR